ncbi:MAG: type II toxin-antitoxin system PemK/MazF family toxin [Deltaproteobacteria bacterium]|jgi:mRNA interferase MazF|nr:type II toxin-antitoxin system PemK/MazF family toxin [Deltaproteobacteria bacterium]MBK9646978.1 type II toxin-antitoxin system PemK/MazF family toxin [Deltaproteobacteria bacterium]
MRRGDLYLAELSPRSGAEIQGGRPVLVVSHDSFNRVTAWQSVMVVPLTTSAAQARRGPTAVPIPDGAGGLRGDGVAVCHQITTLDRTKLSRRLGALPADVLAAVELGIKAALDLP